MTIKELISELSKCPEDYQVLMLDPERGWEDIMEIKQYTCVNPQEEDDWNNGIVRLSDVIALDLNEGDKFIGIF